MISRIVIGWLIQLNPVKPQKMSSNGIDILTLTYPNQVGADDEDSVATATYSGSA